MKGRVLIIAGSDSGGGAGIQADIKTVTALDGFAMTAISALTVQNTLGVFDVFPVPPAVIAHQMRVVIEDIGVDALKTGMLASADVIAAVADEIAARASHVPLVVDPVMVAKGGHKLIEDAAVAALKTRLIARARVITPNLPEAEVLTGRVIRDPADMRAAAPALLALGAKAVLLKGGHLEGGAIHDMLIEASGIEVFTDARIESRHTHGTGCTLASAIATGLAQGMGLREAVIRARAYVRRAIETAPGFGHGHGPLNHAHVVERA